MADIEREIKGNFHEELGEVSKCIITTESLGCGLAAIYNAEITDWESSSKEVG
jgi:hypothetical protein